MKRDQQEQREQRERRGREGQSAAPFPARFPSASPESCIFIPFPSGRGIITISLLILFLFLFSLNEIGHLLFIVIASGIAPVIG